MSFTFIIVTHIDIPLNSSKKNYKRTYKLLVLKHNKIKKKVINLINSQLESFFLFHFSAKRNTFMVFPHQTPKAITSFTEPTTSDLNIKTIICHHSIKKVSPLPLL